MVEATSIELRRALAFVREQLSHLPRAALEAPRQLGDVERGLVTLAWRLEQHADALVRALPPPDRLAWRENTHGETQLRAEELRRVAFQLRIIAPEGSALQSRVHADDFVGRVESLVERVELERSEDAHGDRWDSHLA